MKVTKIKQLFFYTLTTGVSPVGGGTLTVSPLKNKYVRFETVVLTATPASGYSFVGWSGDTSGTVSPHTITMTKDMDVTANFLADAAPPGNYTLATSASPSGSGSITVSPLRGSYTPGEIVTLTANPASGNTFASWGGDASGSTNPTMIVMNSNKSVTANFNTAVQEMEVPAGGIIMYTGGSAPTGFAKEENLKYVMISSINAGNKTPTDGSLADHTHALPASSEAGAHTHSVAGSGNAGGGGSAMFAGGYYENISPVGHEHAISPSSTSTSGAHTHPMGGIEKTAFDTHPPYVILNFIKNTSGGLAVAPVGSIVMFDGALATIPDGWAICDGNNGTVDMRERFVYGTAANTNLLSIGGSKTHTHPAPTVTASGAHAHTYTVSTGNATGEGENAWVQSAGSANVVRSGHKHPALEATTAEQAAHTHVATVPNEASHMPYYIYLYYIQRIT